MKKQLAIMSALTLIAAPALANEVKVEAKAQHYMEKIDTDNNGQISKAEHDAFGDRMFDEADANNDNSITLAELTAEKQKEKDEMKNLEGDGSGTPGNE